MMRRGLENVFYQPDIIVLLTDGANSQGPLPLDAAQQAADRQVRVYTIGFGTTEPGEMVCTQQQLGSDVFGGGFGGGFGPAVAGLAAVAAEIFGAFLSLTKIRYRQWPI